MIDDKEYNKIKNIIFKKLEYEESSISDFRWDISFLSLIKDKNNKQDFVNYINMIRKQTINDTIDKFVWEILDKSYIKIENIPQLEDLIGVITDRIRSNEDSIKYDESKILKNKKLLLILDNYEKTKEIESDIFWDESRISNYKKEIRFYTEMLDIIKYSIKDLSSKIKNKKSKRTRK